MSNEKVIENNIFYLNQLMLIKEYTHHDSYKITIYINNYKHDSNFNVTFPVYSINIEKSNTIYFSKILSIKEVDTVFALYNLLIEYMNIHFEDPFSTIDELLEGLENGNRKRFSSLLNNTKTLSVLFEEHKQLYKLGVN